MKALLIITVLCIALMCCCAVSASSDSTSTDLSAQDQKIIELENRLHSVREEAVLPAAQEVARRRSIVHHARSEMPWMPSVGQKERMHRLEQELHEAEAELARAESHALDLHSRLKPLYGIWSNEFYEEQKDTLQKTLGFVKDASYNGAWWDTLLSSRHESLTDMIVSFFVHWLLSYVLMYPFAGVYFLGWATPKSLWAYSSSPLDLFNGVVVWLISLVAFLVPIALIVGAGHLFLRGRIQAAQRRYEENPYDREAQYARHFIRQKRD
eukprot:PhM_4_TR7778/c0_g1_i1/m.17795